FAMDIRCEQFFPCTGFSGYKYACVRTCDARRLLDRVQKRDARTDHLRTFADNFAKTFILATHARLFERIVKDQQYSVASERFLEEVERAGPGRFDRVGDRAVARNHDDRRAVVVLAQPAQKVNSVAVRELNVEKICIGAAGVAAKLFGGSVDRY